MEALELFKASDKGKVVVGMRREKEDYAIENAEKVTSLLDVVYVHQ